LIITTPRLGECISGTILYDETIRQRKKDGTPFIKAIADAGIIPGIKVDIGAKDLAGHPGEKITEGLDGLRDRLKEYFQMGARFAKWRAVITLATEFPAGVASKPMRRLWPATPHCARKQDRAGRRAGSAHGRRSYSGALPGT
jgi:fructose-bisphosphate aldolase class 1